MTFLTLRTAVVIIGVIFYVLVVRKCSDVLASSSIRAELFRIPFVVCCIFLIFLEKIMWRQPWSGSIIVIRAADRNSSLLHMTGFYVIMMIINVPFMFDSCVVHDYVYCILLNMIDFLVIICTVFFAFLQAFYQLRQLRKLTLSNNQISRLSHDVGNFIELQELDISHNGRESWNYFCLFLSQCFQCYR